MKRRILSIITALALCLSLCPTWALAAEADPALCKHHPEHTEDCGYIAPTEGRDCGHEHTEDCYTLGVLPDADGSNPYEVGADTENLLDCQHTHDSECGYAQADPGQPCGYECRICPIEDLIAALPDKVTEDNADEVRAQLDEILALFSVLTEDEQEQIDLSRCYELQGALDGANDPAPITESVEYQEASWDGSQVTYESKTETCTLVENSAEAVTWTAGWYAVSGTVTIDQPITVTGAVNLILTDGCDLTAAKGIVVPVNNSLTIYAQSGGSGTLTATGTAGAAGIGGGYDGFRGHIAIHGGIVTAKGGGPDPSQSIMGGGAGIGDGYGKADDDGKITIYGGTVTASAVYGGAGIGGTAGHQSGGIINIHGGTVNASGSSVGAGIGGGYSGGGGRITITGGTVTATGYSAGIGGGEATSNGQGGAGGIISITGGIVTANGGSNATAIGKGTNGSDTNSDGSSPSVSIGGNAVVFANHLLEPNTAGWSGVVFDGQTGTVYGNATPNCSFEIPSAATLTILENSSLTISEDITLTNNGTLFQSGTLNGSGTLTGGGTFTADLSEDMVSVPTDLYYNGQDRSNDIKTRLSDGLTQGIVICGQTFTFSGWTVAVSRTDDLHYTATYTNTDNSTTFQKTITLQQSGTTLDGAVKTYNGDTQTTTFTASDTITVKATPTATGEAPANSAMFAASFTGPGAGQMAVFVGDTQVSEAVDAGADGSYTMTVSAADVLAAAGGPGTGITLTAKFVGNNNMADAAGTVPVNISAVAKVEKSNGGGTEYMTAKGLKTVFAYNSGYEGAMVALLDDVTITEAANRLRINIRCTLNLNGHTICSDATGAPALEVSGYGNVTITGSGEIVSNSNPALYVVGTAVLEGGIFRSGCTHCGAVELMNGSLSVTGEDVVMENTGSGNGLLIDSLEPVKLSAGKYSGAAGAISVSTDAFTLSSLLNQEGTSRVAYYQDNTTLVTEGLDGQTLPSGSYTVKACTHTGEGVCEYTHATGTTTHQQTCLACGKKWDVENCSFDENGKCACEAVLAVALKDNTELTYTGEAQTPEVNVTVDGIALAAEKYQLSYDNNINAGNTAKVTVTGTAFTGTFTLPFTIKPATPTIAWDPSYQVLTYTGQPADIKPVITLVNGETYDGPIYYTWPGFTNQLVLPTDAGFNGITASIPAKGNYTAASTEPVLVLTINKVDQDAPAAPSAAEENIKDNSITLDTIENAEYKRDEGEWQTSPVFTGLDPNHEYTFYVRLKEDKNHNASPSSTGATITTKKTMLDGATVTVSGSYTYTGAAVVPAAGNVTVELNGVTIDASQYTISATNNVNVGTSTLTVTATADGNYSGSASTTFTISPATLTIKASDQTITYGQSITEGTGQVTATGLCAGDSLSGITLAASTRNVPGGTIELSAAQIKNSSGGDVTANYNITYEAGTLTINKAQATVTGDPTANTLTYTGAAQALVTAGTASIGEVVYSLTEMGTYSTTIPTGTNAGTYTVWYKVEGTTNYEGTAPVKVDVTIGKANYTGLMTASTSCKYGRDKTYDMSDLLPEGYVLGTITITDTNSIFEGTPTVSGAMLTYKLVNDSQKVNSTGTITIPVTESTNYNPFDLTITVTVTNVRIPNLNVNPISVIYTGNPVNSNQITGTATVDGIAIDGTWSFVSGQAITNVADSGVKRVTFTPNNTDLYGASTGTVVVTISKATPSLILTPSPATLPNGGMVTLTLSGLPDRSSATVTCSDENITVTKGSGNTWTAELPAGGASYTFAASYAGDGNHNGATANCTVRVEKITPVLSLTASPASPLIGGGTVTLTLSGLPAGGTASVTCSGGITVTAGAGNTWTAKLPNSTADYIFTASYAGNDSYHGANATCTVETKEVVILPNPPADDGSTKFQLVMKDGISKVPAGLQNIEALNTPEKLETAMKTAITQANSGVPQANTAVYDVELQISTDGGTTWTKATAGNFPANGLTVTLPYPAGTNSSYTFTVVHMFTTSDFGKTPGDIETPRVINTASGLQFTVTGLSPVSVGWTAPATTPDTPSGGNHGGGGGGSVSTYAVTVEKSEHGKVTSNRTNASNGSTVTLTVTPDSGYVLDALTVTDSRGNEIKLTAQGGNKYTFTMPSRAVTVKASFVPLPDDTQKPCDGGVDCPSRGFSDLGSVGTWYHEAVDYVLRNGLMGGYGNGLFGPNDNLSRAQFAQILFNKEGRPVVNYLLQYGDVAEGAWYTEAIRWATSRGIVGGYGNGTFGPNDNITREQLAVMLWRYAGSPAATDKELHFTDADQASGFALEALRWAVENGIINGYGDGQLAPQGLATRGQVAQMLMNFLKNR